VNKNAANAAKRVSVMDVCGFRFARFGLCLLGKVHLVSLTEESSNKLAVHFRSPNDLSLFMQTDLSDCPLLFEHRAKNHAAVKEAIILTFGAPLDEAAYLSLISQVQPVARLFCPGLKLIVPKNSSLEDAPGGN
jgi:hypothetical protein